MTLLGVYREHRYSPGKIREDAAILDSALEALPLGQYETHTTDPESLDRLVLSPACVLSMAQSDQALSILETWQKNGTRVINSARSVRNSYRTELFRILEHAGVPMPAGTIVPVAEVDKTISFIAPARYWLKRGDVHATEAGDVVSVASPEEMEKALDHFHRRAIRDILIQEHVDGEIIKFYGVGQGEYLSAFSVTSGRQISDGITDLAAIAHQAAEAVGLEIYGGDVVLSPGGHLVLIDLNDWPSFSRCCRAAAHSIAAYVTNVCKGVPHES